MDLEPEPGSCACICNENTIVWERLNPLSISHILEQVMDHVSFTDLKNSRLVCREWEANLKLQFRDRALINLETLEELEIFNANITAGNPALANYRLGRGIPMQSEAFLQFCQKFGCSIRSIHFNYCDWTGTGPMFRNILEGLFPILQELQIELSTPVRDILNSDNYLTMCLPNLRSLIVDFPVMYNWEWFLVETKYFFYNFMLHAPFLETIMYSGCKVPCSSKDFIESYSCQVIFELITMTESLKLRNLKNFQIIRRYSCDQLQMMEAKKLNLQNLHLILFEDQDGKTSDCMCSLILSLRNTLRNLTIVFLNEFDFSHKKFYCLGQLKRLESLKLEGYKGSLKFLHQVPSLKLITEV